MTQQSQDFMTGHPVTVGTLTSLSGQPVPSATRTSVTFSSSTSTAS
ncbi:hypothetical protein OTB20_37195 [Streptomyces sp. H27-H1]|nr:hypothetical protein [Streptomyces sp. H27-H1]MCY0931724.1 hypothetical protein [Streptomyces sp. H27-H1]